MRLLSFPLALFVLTACSSKSTPAAPTDAGSSVTGTDSGSVALDGGSITGPRVDMRGRMLDFDTHKPIAGVTVTAGDVEATTDALGTWTLSLTPGVAAIPTMTGANYVKLYTEEILPTASADLGDIQFPKVSTFHLAGGTLKDYDISKGVLYINMFVTSAGTCPSFTGAVVTVDSPQDTVTDYFSNGLPRETLTAAEDGNAPAAVVYNIPPGSDVHITVTHPTCTVSTFPHTENGVVYTGKIYVGEGNDSNVATRFYLE